MTTLVGNVTSKTHRGVATLTVGDRTQHAERGERVTLEIGDGQRFVLQTKHADVTPVMVERGRWSELARSPLGVLFRDVAVPDSAIVELRGWVLNEGDRLAIAADLGSHNQPIARHIAIVPPNAPDQPSIDQVEAAALAARPAPPPRPQPAAAPPVVAVPAPRLHGRPPAAPSHTPRNQPGVRHIEMFWRCSACNNQNLGRFKTCRQCGDPKDGSERYEMPADTAAAVSVTDADLLRMATAGPDWRCAYCGSDQRQLDGSCAHCGASKLAGEEVPEDEPQTARRATPTARRNKLIRYGTAGVGVTAALIGGLVWNAKRPRDYDAKVTAVTWEHVIQVDRFAVRTREGFRENLPSAAFETVSVGDRVHHHEQVLDHYDTEYYTVQVPDGYRTEHYTERVSCGQDCTDTPERCSESCTSDRNGFATCRTTCSGGGRSCSTRYCNESRTRQVAKTRSEQRSRQVPKYRSEPRYAEGFRYKVWDWEPERTLREAGTEVTGLRWPEGSARATGLPDGEQERERRIAKYTVTLRYDDDHTVRFSVSSPEELARFGQTSKHNVHIEDNQLTVDGLPIRPL